MLRPALMDMIICSWLSTPVDTSALQRSRHWFHWLDKTLLGAPVFTNSSVFLVWTIATWFLTFCIGVPLLSFVCNKSLFLFQSVGPFPFVTARNSTNWSTDFSSQPRSSAGKPWAVALGIREQLDHGSPGDGACLPSDGADKNVVDWIGISILDRIHMRHRMYKPWTFLLRTVFQQCPRSFESDFAKIHFLTGLSLCRAFVRAKDLNANSDFSALSYWNVVSKFKTVFDHPARVATQSWIIL